MITKIFFMNFLDVPIYIYKKKLGTLINFNEFCSIIVADFQLIFTMQIN